MREAGPEGRSIGENRKDDGLEDSLPVHEIEAPDGVPKHVESTDGGAGMVGHRANMQVP